jgi:hypothetical protein
MKYHEEQAEKILNPSGTDVERAWRTGSLQSIMPLSFAVRA